MRRLGELAARWLEPRNIRFVCASVVGVCMAYAVVSLYCGRNANVGGDYPAFYLAGQILNQNSSDRLYDRSLQSQLYHELRPAEPAELSLPFVNPPFVAWLFRPLAMLPYRWSYAVWLMISLGLCAIGVTLVGRSVPAMLAQDRRTALWLALSFEPFIVECWVGGQLSAVGLFLVCAAMERDRRGEKFQAGLALGLLCYKPTLLVLVLPALAAGRQWKLLLGTVVSIAALAGVSWLGNADAGRAYAQLLGDYLRTTVNDPGVFRVWKFVDLRSFFHLWFGGQSRLSWLLVAAVGVPFLVLLLRSWARYAQVAETRPLLWSATLAGTLVVNLYVGIYDTVLMVPAMFLLSAAAPAGEFRKLIVLIWLVPWFSQWLAQTAGLQVFTLVLAACSIYPLVLARRLPLESRA